MASTEQHAALDMSLEEMIKGNRSQGRGRAKPDKTAKADKGAAADVVGEATKEAAPAGTKEASVVALDMSLEEVISSQNKSKTQGKGKKTAKNAAKEDAGWKDSGWKDAGSSRGRNGESWGAKASNQKGDGGRKWNGNQDAWSSQSTYGNGSNGSKDSWEKQESWSNHQSQSYGSGSGGNGQDYSSGGQGGRGRWTESWGGSWHKEEGSGGSYAHGGAPDGGAWSKQAPEPARQSWAGQGERGGGKSWWDEEKADQSTKSYDRPGHKIWEADGRRADRHASLEGDRKPRARQPDSRDSWESPERGWRPAPAPKRARHEEPPRDRRDGKDGPTMVVVKGIPPELDHTDILKAFQSETGPIMNCVVGRGTAWITFEHMRHAQKAVDTFDRGELNGREIKVSIES